MTFLLRKQFSRGFKEKLWKLQFGAPQFGAPQFGAPQFGAPQFGAPQFGATPGVDPYGNKITLATSSLDHIVPISFFNKNLEKKADPLLFLERFRAAANCQDNLQFLDSKTNRVIGSSFHGKKTRHGTPIEDLVAKLDSTFNLELKKMKKKKQ